MTSFEISAVTQFGNYPGELTLLGFKKITVLVTPPYYTAPSTTGGTRESSALWWRSGSAAVAPHLMMQIFR